MSQYNISVTRDDDIVAKAKTGDKAAFEQLYRLNVGRVYAICFRIVVDEPRAEELTQETFIRAWEMLQSFRGESAFSSWLYRIAVNVVLVDLRSRKRRAARIDSNSDADMIDGSEQLNSPEMSLDLEDAIASLPPKARAIFVLHEIEGYQHHEIAEMLDLAVGTTKAQLHRARKLLKERLQR